MVRVLDRLTHDEGRPIALLILCAIACSTLAIAAGVLGSLSYIEDVEPVGGLTLQHLRPVHTTFAVAWIYVAACAVVYFYLIRHPSAPHGRAFWLRAKAQVALWAVAGVGSLVSLCMGVFSGREYMGAHWIWSVLIFLGWILFAWNFVSVVGLRLRGQPAFIYMWMTALALFMWTFIEGHSWHLAIVGEYPLRDIAMQWKSYGPLVGSFNLLVYGSFAYLACRLTGDDRPAYSNTVFALFFLGVLNSFTNFGHHTYHLPQSHVVKWISCIVSLLEIILVAKYALEVVKILKSKSENTGVRFVVLSATTWSFIMVAIAVAISVPPVNALIHGTHFVMAHAMGSMLGIDSVILWAVLLYLLQCMLPEQHRVLRPRAVVGTFTFLNVAIFLVFALLAVKGIVDGYLRYMGPAAPAPPEAMTLFPVLLVALGSLLALAILWVNLAWARALLPCLRRRTATAAPVAAPPPLERERVTTP